VGPSAPKTTPGNVAAGRPPAYKALVWGPLERTLFLTIVAGLVPLAVLALIVLLQSAQNQRQQLLDSSQRTMLAIMSAVDAEFDATIASLDALAASPRVAANDLAGLHGEARELLSRRPRWANVVLSDAAGNQLMNARLAVDAPLPSQNPFGIAETVAAEAPVVTNVVYAPVLETYAFGVQVPIRRGAEVTHVLTAVLRSDAMQELLRDQELAEQGVVGLFDRNYNVVARTLNYEETVGRSASAGLYETLASGQRSGWRLTTTLEGVPVYTVLYRSSRSGWAAAVGVPVSVADAPTQRSYVIFGALLVGSVLLGIATALFVSRAITKPMRELTLAAEEMGHGTPPLVPTTDLPEIRNVAAALVAAHAERESLLAAERQSKEQEREARLTAERANRLKDEFLAMLGHELRNPLAAINAASLVLEMTAGKPNAETSTRNTIGIIRRQSSHLARLTDDLLDAGRVVLGRIELDRRPLELAAVVRGSIETLRATNALAGHAVSAALHPVWINADATRIDQIVSNLLTNAIKYTPAPGSIDVRVERVGDQAVLRVRDSGIGIERELMPRIFELFVQGQRAPDRSQGGLGIGLTMVRRLVELHGGSVQASSAGPGAGSEFTVTLPVAEAGAEAGGADAQLRADAPLSIVIVEDNADVSGSLRALLELGGHTVVIAADGQSGIELITRLRPDLALVDIGLPIVDGYAVARAVRARAELHATLLVAMTGYGGREDVEEGRKAGFDEYLVKPADEAKLRDIIRRARPAARPRAQSKVLPFGHQR
jgi:signal transduction histidine kinase/ActR/RegA family two-component response regulator